jgi:antitoxin PrlF
VNRTIGHSETFDAQFGLLRGVAKRTYSPISAQDEIVCNSQERNDLGNHYSNRLAKRREPRQLQRQRTLPEFPAPKARLLCLLCCNAFLHYNQSMTTLTITARGQVTFRKDVLQHLGIRPGERIELDKLPDGRITLRAVRPSGKIDSFIGLLAGKTKKVASLDEINEAAKAGWAGQK